MSNSIVQQLRLELANAWHMLDIERAALQADVAELRTERDIIRENNDKLGDENRRLTAERDALKADYERACQTVAAMHEAALGVTGFGPNRGVVEDVADLRAERDALRRELDALKINPTLLCNLKCSFCVKSIVSTWWQP